MICFPVESMESNIETEPCNKYLNSNKRHQILHIESLVEHFESLKSNSSDNSMGDHTILIHINLQLSSDNDRLSYVRNNKLRINSKQKLKLPKSQ